MSRIRTIKPSFFRSLTIADLPVPTRLTFVGLWTYVDDDGRGVDDARLIKAELWPLDDTYSVKKVEADLQRIEKANLIERYDVDSKRFLRVRSWIEHQHINRPSPSNHPPSPEESLNNHGGSMDRSLPEGKGIRKGKERKTGRDSSLNEPSGLRNKTTPLPFCEECDHGWLDDGHGGVEKCSCQTVRVPA